MKKWQFVWWGLTTGLYKRFGLWGWPRDYKTDPIYKGIPLFYGLVLGLFEIRYFPDREKLEENCG